MTDRDGRSRFCVLFTGTLPHWPVKPRVLHSDSGAEDIRLIWHTLYNENPPPGAQIIINGNCVYRLDDAEDLRAFFAQAEDQYNILPAQPLKAYLGFEHDFSLYQENAQASLAKLTAEKAKDLTVGTINENNNNSCLEQYKLSPSRAIKTEPVDKANEKTISQVKLFESFCNNMSNSAVVPYSTNALTPVSEAFINMYSKPKLSAGEFSGQTVEGAIERISGESSSRAMSSKQELNDNHKELLQRHNHPILSYANQIAEQSKSQFLNSQQQVNQTNVPGAFAQQFNMPTYSAFLNRIQENRAMQTTPSPAFILQTFINHQMRSIAAARESIAASQNQSLPPHLNQYHSQMNNNDTTKAFFQNPMAFSNKPSTSSTSEQSEANKNAYIFSSLAYNNNSLLNNYTPGNGVKQDNVKSEYIQPPPKKRRRAKTANAGVGGKAESSKRMRSSTSQSNIEYHCQRAVEYSQMAVEEQKQQNSAHRSHWKHLLFVIKTSPSFLETFKHAKYDEWSSEARDIFAISQPDKYMWSFLTLSKQGDLLCRRITGRIGDLLDMKAEERPDWCPPNEILERAQTKAKERLSQLQRILFSRAVNKDNGKNRSNDTTTSANQNDKFTTLQDQGLAFMSAYQQRQQQLFQNHSALDAQRISFLPFSAAQSSSHQPSSSNLQARPSYPSSVSSSPPSNVSPTVEQPRFNQDGGSHSEQTDTPPSTPGEVTHGRNGSDNDGCLVIDTERKTSSEKSPQSSHNQDNKDSDTVDTMNTSTGLISSPHRWSIAT